MRYVIIGAGPAGVAAAETLRRWDPPGAITLISDEPHPPYSRPLLTYLLSGEVSLERIWLREEDYFEKWGFTLLLGEAVTGVDPQAREVRLASGRVCPYDRLLIATGARPRRPGLPGEDLAGVFTLRTLADWRRLEAGLPPGGAVAVVGAGPVGLKVADALAQRGCRVSLVELESQVLPNLLDRDAAGLLEQALARLDIQVYCQAPPAAILGREGRVEAVALANGRKLPAQAVLLAIGVSPCTDFLSGTGLDEPSGITVNAALQTSQPGIYAAGDCVRALHLLTGAPAYYPIWPAAVAQGQVAGANMAGASRRYPGILPQNSLTVKGFRVISGGLIQPDPECRVVCEQDGRGNYRRLVFREDRLVGVTLVGEVREAGLYFQILSQQLPADQLPAVPRTPDFHPGRLWG
jgi:NAD(P)H-nitrite reductase large subunit